MPSLTRPPLARLAVAWGVLFAVAHAYWAAGGAAGMNGEPADTPVAQAYVGVIAVLGLVAAALAHAHTHDLGARLGRRRVTLLERVAATLLLAGVAVGVARWAVDGGLGDDGAAGIAITAYFLAGGLLFAGLARDRDTPDLTPAPPSGSPRASATRRRSRA